MVKKAQTTQAEKAQATKEKAKEGTTKPLPTADKLDPEQKAAEERIALLVQKRKELQEELKKIDDEKKSKAEALKAAKKAERDKEVQERESKKKAIEALDAKIAQCQKDLEATEEYKWLLAAKAEREKIGPLPKVRKGGGGKREPRDPNAGPATYGIERDHDLPWCEKKEKLFKALADNGAVSPTTALATSEAADAAGLIGRDVRHYGYHAKAGGLVDIANVEGKVGYCFYLTEAGIKELKEQTKAK